MPGAVFFCLTKMDTMAQRSRNTENKNEGNPVLDSAEIQAPFPEARQWQMTDLFSLQKFGWGAILESGNLRSVSLCNIECSHHCFDASGHSL